MITSSHSIKSILQLAKEEPRAVFIVCSCLVIASLFEALGVSAIFPLISLILDMDADLPDSWVTDIILALQAKGPMFLASVVIGCFILKSLILYMVISVVASYVANYTHDLRKTYVEALLGAKIGFIQSKSLGQNIAILTNDSMRAAAAYVSATRFMAAVFQATVYIAYAFWLSAAATGIAAITVIVLMLLIRKTMGRTREAGLKTTESMHEVSKSMGEALRGMKEAKATGNEGYLLSYIVRNSGELKEAHKANTIVSQTMRNIQDPVTITSALVCLFFFKDVIHLEPVYIVFMLAVYYRMMSSVNILVGEFQKFVAQESALWSIRDGIKTATDEVEKRNDGGEKLEAKTYNIKFEGVSKQYDDKKVFEDISFEIPFKSLCLFKGESGKGKTTCIDMICGLLEPDKGHIKIDDHDLTELDTQSWRMQIGYVDQFPFLFKGSVRDNILMGIPDVSDEVWQRTLKQCHLESFVQNLEGGLDFELNEGGSNISGGQRQRIAIARSVIRNPSYLILDEPTSALDQDSAEVIMQTLSELTESMTVIMISHSPVAAVHADLVIDFDKF